jgi:hypothetical protein
MRFLPAVLVTLLAAAIAAGSAPAVDRAPGASDASARVFYLFYAKFDLTYEVEWSTTSGNLSSDCEAWRRDRGVTTVVARDAPRKRRGDRRPRRYGIPGSITVFGRFEPRSMGGWADGSAVGKATATVHRRWVQRGENRHCSGVPPKPFQPTPSDCGERRYKTSSATLMPQMRNYLRTLEDVMTIVGPRRRNEVEVLSLSVPAGRELYRSCMLFAGVPEVPSNLGFPLDEVTKDELLTLRPGETVRDEWRHAADCSRDIPDGFECRFKMDVDVEIRRVRPGERFP